MLLEEVAMAKSSSSGDAGVKATHGGERRGLEGAKARGAAAKEAWVRDGLLVSREVAAQRWGVSLEEIAAMFERGELFELEADGKMWVPAVFLELPRDVVAEVNRALAGAGADPSASFVFWQRKHGALRGRTVAASVRQNTAPGSVTELARTYFSSEKSQT